MGFSSSDELFDAYLRGEISVNRARSIEEQLEQDPDFAREFQAYKQYFEIIDQATEQIRSKDSFAALQKSMQRLDEKNPLNALKRFFALPRYGWITLGISLLALVTLIKPLGKPQKLLHPAGADTAAVHPVPLTPVLDTSGDSTRDSLP